MERNFTYERKIEIRDFIEASLSRWIQLDLEIESTSNFLSVLGFRNITGFADAYRGRVVQKLKTDLDILEEKYKDAGHIEKMYSTKHIAEARQSIQSLNEYIMRLAEMISYKNGDIDVSKEAFINLMWNSYESKFEKMQTNREFAYDVESIVYDVYGIRKNVNDVGIASQKYVVEAYELIHPEIKAKMDKFLSTGEPNVLTENDITSIKYLAYTAPEPYRTVYLESVEKYEFACIYNNESNYRAFYSYEIGKIYIQNANSVLNNDKRGPYTTLLHECGHATDAEFSEKDKVYFCVEYQTNSDFLNVVKENIGKEYVTLQDAIYYDVYNNITEKIKNSGVTDEVKIDNIFETFQYGSDISKLTEDEKIIREMVIEEYKTELVGERNNAAGDVYGGVTNLIISGEGIYGHYPDDGDVSNFSYWYSKNGKPTKNQSIELWAHYFACNLTGDKEAQASIRKYFPEATKVLDEIVIYMGEEVNAQ